MVGWQLTRFFYKDSGNLTKYFYRYTVVCKINNFHIFFKSAIKEDQNFGRAKNGMFIAVPVDLKEKFSDVSPPFWRVQAVTFLSTLLVNVYSPTDPGTLDYDDNCWRFKF